MNDQDARKFISNAVGNSGGVWADIGAGEGTFTKALASFVANGSRIYAIDRDPSAIAALAALGPPIVAIRADFIAGLSIPEPLDGIVLANALHFAPDAGNVLTQLVRHLKPNGRVILIEYDSRASSPWVPYPIPSARWAEVAARAGLRDPQITARRKSQYAGELYVATATKP